MKKLLLLVISLIGFTGFSQEKREYEKISENELSVKVYYDNKLIQEGKMLNHQGIWVNNGKWSQYNPIGEVELIVKYEKGRKKSISKLSQVKTINYF